MSQEAVRAEIQKDMKSLMELKPVHKLLAARKVDMARLQSIHDAAQALTGHLGEKTVKKAGAKKATGDEHEAVAAQKARWASCYRILAATGREDIRVQQLLAEAARK